MNLTINIIGNIGSGKSTLIEKLKSEFNNCFFFQIDSYREEYYSNSSSMDSYCWFRMIEDVEKTQIAIVESTGTSMHFDTLCSVLNRDVLTVELACEDATCSERVKFRKSNGFQIGQAFSLEQSITYISRKLSYITAKSVIDANVDKETVYESFVNCLHRHKIFESYKLKR